MTEIVYGEAGEEHPMGWGEEGDLINHRLMKERAERSRLEDEGTFSEVDQLAKLRIQTFGADETPMEKRCREMFEFDGGWCFHTSEKLLYGAPLVHSQGSVGSCVGAGGGLSLAAKAAQEILNEGDPEDPYGWSTQDGNRDKDHAMPFTGYHYGAGRCKNLWDGEKFRGRNRSGDGSYCSVQIWAYRTTGILPCRFVRSSSSPFPQCSDVRSWGNNAGDELNAHLKIGQQFLMRNTVVCRNAEELWKTVTELKQPAHVCSGWGFRPRGGVDSKYGIQLYSRSGSWAHNMTFYGAIEIKNGRFFVVKNSWGEGAHKPIGRGLPLGCFVVTYSETDRWLRQAECMSIGELTLPESLPEEF